MTKIKQEENLRTRKILNRKIKYGDFYSPKNDRHYRIYFPGFGIQIKLHQGGFVIVRKNPEDPNEKHFSIIGRFHEENHVRFIKLWESNGVYIKNVSNFGSINKIAKYVTHCIKNPKISVQNANLFKQKIINIICCIILEHLYWNNFIINDYGRIRNLSPHLNIPESSIYITLLDLNIPRLCYPIVDSIQEWIKTTAIIDSTVVVSKYMQNELGSILRSKSLKRLLKSLGLEKNETTREAFTKVAENTTQTLSNISSLWHLKRLIPHREYIKITKDFLEDPIPVRGRLSYCSSTDLRQIKRTYKKLGTYNGRLLIKEALGNYGGYFVTDTIRMANLLKHLHLRERYSNIRDLHDDLAKLVEQDRLAKMEDKIINVPERWLAIDGEKFEVDEKTFVISIMKSYKDVVLLGQEFHNCVGSYADNAADGMMLIIAVRDTEGNPKQCIGIKGFRYKEDTEEIASSIFQQNGPRNNLVPENEKYGFIQVLYKHKLKQKLSYSYNTSSTINYEGYYHFNENVYNVL